MEMKGNLERRIPGEFILRFVGKNVRWRKKNVIWKGGRLSPTYIQTAVKFLASFRIDSFRR
jgi:hypothetical protein